MKTCKRCNTYLPLAAFHKKTGGRFGVGTVCKSCRSEQEKARFVEKRDHILAVNRRAYARDREERAERNRRYREANRVELAAYDQQRGYLKNILCKLKRPEYYRAVVAEHARRRAFREKRATPPWANTQAIREVYIACQMISEMSGEMHHVDHIVPIVFQTRLRPTRRMELANFACA